MVAGMKQDAHAKAYADAVAAVIRRHRERVDLSKNRLAEGAGLSQPMIGLIERGIHAPTVATLYRIARVLGTTPSAILSEVETDTKSFPPEKTTAMKAQRKTPPKRRVPPSKRAGNSELKKRPKPL